jgi:hypothetical protein
VEACPEDAIRMDPGLLEVSAYSRGGMIYSKEILLSLEPAGAEGLPTMAPPPALWRQGLESFGRATREGDSAGSLPPVRH